MCDLQHAMLYMLFIQPGLKLSVERLSKKQQPGLKHFEETKATGKTQCMAKVMEVVNEEIK